MSIENIDPVAFYGKGIYLTNNATNRSIIGKATKFEKLYTEKQMQEYVEKRIKEASADELLNIALDKRFRKNRQEKK